MTNLELISELKQRIENETFGYIKIMDKPDDDILKKCYQMRYSGWWMKTGLGNSVRAGIVNIY